MPAKKGARVRGFVAGCENGFAYVFCKYKHDYKWHFQNTSSNHSHIASGDAGLQGMDSRTTLVAKRRGSRIQRRGAHKIADPEKCTQFYFSPNMPFSVAAILVSDGNIYEPGYNVELMREYAKKQGCSLQSDEICSVCVVNNVRSHYAKSSKVKVQFRMISHACQC